MSEGRNIDIKVAVTGGAESAAEIRKGEKAIADLTQEMKDGEKAAAAFAKQLDDDTTRQRAVSRVKEVALATGAVGIAAGYAAKALNTVWQELEKVDTVELKKLDAAWAEQIENAKKFKEAIADPIGALAALANSGTTVKEAFADMNEQMKLNAESAQAQIDRMIAKAAVNVGEIKKLATDIKTANELLAAQDELASVKRSGQAAEAIRNGADPDDVAAGLAKAEAADKIAAIERRQEEIRREESPQAFFDSANASRAEAARIKAESEKKLADADAEVKRRAKEGSEINPVLSPFKFAEATSKFADARANRDAIRGDKTDDEAIKTAEAQAAASQKAFEAAQKKVRETDERAAVEKQIIRAGLDNRVSEFGARKTDRLKADESRREDAGFEARKNFQDFQEYRRGQAADGQREGAAKAGRDAVALLPQGARQELADSVKAVSKRLQDGDQGGELGELAGLLREMGSSLAAKDAQRVKDIAALKRELEVQAQRLRNRS